MYFALDDQQRLFVSAVRQQFAAVFGPTQRRALVDDTEVAARPAAVWEAMCNQGLLAMMIDPEHGGLGLGMLDAQAVASELGRALVPNMWMPAVLAGEAIRLAGTTSQQRQHLPAIAEGRICVAVALRGVHGRYASTDAPFVEFGGLLNGAAEPVEFAQDADLFVVNASPGSADCRLFLVERRTAGVSIDALSTDDRTSQVARLRLRDVPAIPLPGSTRAILGEVLDRGAALAAADLAGLGRESLSRTVSYDIERRQFGVPVGSFQAIKHALADLHVAVTMTEHAALYAGHAFDAGLPTDQVQMAVSVAKSKSSATAKAVTAAMVQYHGGLGYTWEHDAHLFYKRARRLASSYGGASFHNDRLAMLGTELQDTKFVDTESVAAR